MLPLPQTGGAGVVLLPPDRSVRAWDRKKRAKPQEAQPEYFSYYAGSNKFTTATFNSLLGNLKELQFLSMSIEFIIVDDNPIDNMDALLTEEPIRLKKLQL